MFALASIHSVGHPAGALSSTGVTGWLCSLAGPSGTLPSAPTCFSLRNASVFILGIAGSRCFRATETLSGRSQPALGVADGLTGPGEVVAGSASVVLLRLLDLELRRVHVGQKLRTRPLCEPCPGAVWSCWRSLLACLGPRQCSEVTPSGAQRAWAAPGTQPWLPLCPVRTWDCAAPDTEPGEHHLHAAW